MTTRPPRRADETLDALADAFDTVAPHDRAAAEEELLDAGLDPRAVARRAAELRTDTGARTQARPAPVAAGTWRWQRWAIAAALLLAVGAVLLSGRLQPERTVRVAPAPRTIEPPAGRVVPEAVEPGRSDPAVGRPGAPRSTRADRASGASGSRRGGARHDGVIPLAPQEAALLPLLPDALEPLMRRRIVSVREVAVDPAVIAGLQSPAFLEASAANAGHFETVPTCRLQARGFPGAPVRERFGYPFPTINATSPNAACEIVWNAEAAFAAGGGRRGRATACGVASSYRERGDEQATQCWDAQFRSLAFVGRAGGPIENPLEARAASLLRVFDLPDAAGVGLATGRPIADGDDKYWLFVGESRRVRREPQPQMADDRLRLSLDDLDCFSASPGRYEWVLRGGREVLAPLSGHGLPLYRKGDNTEGGGELLTAMRRDTWVVEGIERNGRRVLLFIDHELYRPYWKIEYEGRELIAAFACGAGWTRTGGDVVPLTSSVIRFDARGGRTDRLVPTDETIDPALGHEDMTVKALMNMER